MCLSIPSRVTHIDENNMASVDTMGVKREVTLDLIDEKVEIGDYVLIHGGFAMHKISKEEAQDSLELYDQIVQQMKNEEIDKSEGDCNYAT